MEGLAFFPCATTAAANTAAATTAINPPHTTCFSKHTRVSQFRKSKSLSVHKKSPKKFAVFASKDEPELDQWDQLELKFGQLLGEDPKLTLAKIMGKKLNPDMTYLEIEKLYNKKDKFANDVEEAPFGEVEKGRQSKLQSGLNLVHPVPQKGAKFESQNKQTASEQKKPSQPAPKKMDNAKSSVPNVILRKPTVFNEDDVNENSSRLRIQPNLSLRMGSQWPEGRFSDITLLKKPEPSIVNMGSGKNQDVPGDVETKDSNGVVENKLQSVSLSTETTDGVALLEKPGLINLDISSDQEQKSFKCHDGLSIRNDVAENSFKSANTSTDAVNVAKVNRNLSQENRDFSSSAHSGQENITELQQLEQNDIGPAEKNLTNADRISEMTALDVTAKSSIEAALQGKPKRLDQTMTVTSSMNRNQIPHANGGSYSNPLELEDFLVASPIKEHDDADWSRAEDLIKRGGKVEVELLSCSTRGFVVSFGSLIGFLPYRNLSAKWKFLAFESWVRRKGLDPAKYKKKLGVIGGCQTTSDMASDDSGVNLQIDQTVEGTVSPDMKLLDLLRIYDQEKLKFLTSFVGQKVRAIVTLADRNSRRLIFSVKPKEKEELIEKKRSLMAKVSVGDVVKCCIKKITYFGIFVEVEGVPALIHQTEVSWDATLDPASYYKIGQTVEAKVHQLDFSLERIFLSLKEVTPDPLMEALEAVVGDHESIGGRLQAAQADDEWADLESLMKELQQFDGIQSVSKGRSFLSPGLAPTFQVYMASMFENQYKLLARSGNRIQEVIVEASLGKEDMKSAILTCTNRVE